MKVKKYKINAKVNSSINICKKCGEPLRSTNKNKYCDNCRRDRARIKKDLLGAVGGICILGVSLIPGVKKFIDKK